MQRVPGEPRAFLTAVPLRPHPFLSRYAQPDFDPSKLPKGKRVRSEDKQMKVRMMLPMSVR